MFSARISECNFPNASVSLQIGERLFALCRYMRSRIGLKLRQQWPMTAKIDPEIVSIESETPIAVNDAAPKVAIIFKLLDRLVSFVAAKQTELSETLRDLFGTNGNRCDHAVFTFAYKGLMACSQKLLECFYMLNVGILQFKSDAWRHFITLDGADMTIGKKKSNPVSGRFGNLVKAGFVERVPSTKLLAHSARNFVPFKKITDWRIVNADCLRNLARGLARLVKFDDSLFVLQKYFRRILVIMPNSFSTFPKEFVDRREGYAELFSDFPTTNPLTIKFHNHIGVSKKLLADCAIRIAGFYTVALEQFVNTRHRSLILLRKRSHRLPALIGSNDFLCKWFERVFHGFIINIPKTIKQHQLTCVC